MELDNSDIEDYEGHLKPGEKDPSQRPPPAGLDIELEDFMDNDDEDSPTASNDKIMATQALPPSDSALIRLEKVRQVKELENKRKKSMDYIWNDKKRPEKFCKKRKKLAADVEQLGAMTGCYGYLYLSKYEMKILILLILIDRKLITRQRPSSNTSSRPSLSINTRI